MKKISLSFSVVMVMALEGCSSSGGLTQNAIAVKLPDPPSLLQSKCSNLQLLPIDSKMQDFANVVATNYESYHECAKKNSTWIEWYQKQKDLFNSKKYYQE